MTAAVLLFSLFIFQVVVHVVVSADWTRRKVLIVCLGVATTTAAAPCARDGIDHNEESHPPASKKPKLNHVSDESMRSDRDCWKASVSLALSASAAVASGGVAPDSDCTSTTVGLVVDRDEAAMDEAIMQGHSDFIRSVIVHM